MIEPFFISSSLIMLHVQLSLPYPSPYSASYDLTCSASTKFLSIKLDATNTTPSFAKAVLISISLPVSPQHSLNLCIVMSNLIHASFLVRVAIIALTCLWCSHLTPPHTFNILPDIYDRLPFTSFRQDSLYRTCQREISTSRPPLSHALFGYPN